MSTSAIISPVSYPNPAVNYESFRAPSPQQSTQLPGTTPQEDVVQLSQFALLARQGQSPSVIAASTGLPINLVDIDLGVSAISPSLTIAVQNGGENPATTAATTSSQTATPAHTISLFA